MNYEQMTLKMQDALQSASSLAQQRDHSEIGNEHLLYAMLNQKDGMIPPLVERIGLEPSSLQKNLENLLDKYPVVKGQTQMSLSSSAQKVLAKAEKEMASLKDQFLSTEHVFLAMIQADDNVGELLRKSGCDRNTVLEALKSVRGNQSIDSQDPESKMRSLEKYCTDLTARARQDKIDPVIGRDAEILREDETPAALDLGDKVGIDRLVRRAVGVAHMRRHGADDKAVFQLKVADLAGLKYFFQFHSIPPVLHAHAGSGRCAAAWAIAIVGLFLPKNLCDFNNALFCNDEPKSKYIQKSS